MNYVRRGNDITTEWTILTQGQPVSLLGRDIHVYLTNVSGTVLQELAPVTDYLIGGEHDNVLTILFPGSRQKELGTFGYTIAENPGKEGMKTLDSGSAFTLVGQTSNSDYATLGAFRSELTGDLINGLNGLSAFQIWQRHGHEGETEEQFLESLIGPPGPQGPPGPPGELTPEQIEGIRRGGRAYAMSVGQGVWLSTERTLDDAIPAIPDELRRLHFKVDFKPYMMAEWLVSLHGVNTLPDADINIAFSVSGQQTTFSTSIDEGVEYYEALDNLYYDALGHGQMMTLQGGAKMVAFYTTGSDTIKLRISELVGNHLVRITGNNDYEKTLVNSIPSDSSYHEQWMFNGSSLSDLEWYDTSKWVYVGGNMIWND